jgi:glutathione-specific gamma-glutamylcyclotransferase
VTGGGAMSRNAAREDDDFWVFAYGSLIWNPGFPYISREPVTLRGYRRRYCIRSMIYRGTPAAPGLVLGLEEGERCDGIGYRVAGELKAVTMQYLRERELITAVYRETIVSIETRDGALKPAYAYVADPSHEQFAEVDELDAVVDIIDSSTGIAGPNYEYAMNTWAKLAEFGIADEEVERVADALMRRGQRS